MGDGEKKELRYDFDGKVAIVTGGAAGIGRAIATAFAHQGTAVVIADIDIEGGEETVRRIQEVGGKAVFLRTDVSSEDDVRNLVAFTVDRYGKLNFACNNAGIEGAQVPIADLPRDRWDQVVAVNLTGVFECLKFELQQMLKQVSGTIVNVASVAGFIGTPARAGYAATKHGIIGLTKTAALEVATKGIRVNAVAPGLVNAGLTDAAPREFIEMALAAQPIGRMAEAEEIASAVLWLCSDESSFVLGHILAVEGGLTIR
jgi:NAD(P)-dependent dehydrogenase (short-subunit alcohol dehydrogenase family)